MLPRDRGGVEPGGGRVSTLSKQINIHQVTFRLGCCVCSRANCTSTMVNCGQAINKKTKPALILEEIRKGPLISLLIV